MLVPLACAKPVAPEPPEEASAEVSAPVDTPDAEGPRIWLTEEQAQFPGIGGCSFGVRYSGFPAVDPSGEEVVTAAWDDPGDNLGEEDLGRLRIARSTLDGRRDTFIVYDAEAGPCEAIRATIETRVGELRTELASWKPLPRIVGAAAPQPGGSETLSEPQLSAFIEDATLVFQDGDREVLRLELPAIENWDAVDAIHGDAEFGGIVVAVRAYGLKEADLVDLVIARVPPSFFGDLVEHQRQP